MYKHRRLIVSLIAGVLAASLLVGIVLMALTAGAVSSDEIKKEIEELQKKADELDEQHDQLISEIDAKDAQTLSVVEQKQQLDQELGLLISEIDNANEQIRQYNQLIAQKQAELDELQETQNELTQRYKLRMRTMQELGDVSNWEVVFQAESFADMLSRKVMVSEVAAADQEMIDEVRTAADALYTAKAELAEERVAAEQVKANIAQMQASLEEKRAQSDEVLSELVADKDELLKQNRAFEDQEAELSDEIAKAQVRYQEQKAKEEEAERKRREEEERRRQEEEAKNNNNNNGNNGNNGSNGNNNSEKPKPSESFLYPLPSGAVLTSAYGYRVHPITGNYSLHNGVDLAIDAGTPIYAAKSGYVSEATYSYVYGYYVTINHMDGFSTLYGHMTNYIVSSGQYVNRGDVIGYVGTTGWSTGNHLHFTIYYNGSTVNPLDYVSVQ